ncbi:MAG: AAA family ATPase [Candidatus Riflebacteria bacterium]|nr:AAA family ATPase [Candidatus Riflebacteria bacterium]
MLKSLQLREFKSFASEQVEFGRLTLLVGANATGKSNLLDALRFLHGLSLGLSVADDLRGHWEGGRELWPGIRGGPREILRNGASTFALTSRWDSLSPGRLEHAIECTIDPQPAVTMERLTEEGQGEYLYDTHGGSLGTATGLQQGGALNVAVRPAGPGRSARSTVASTHAVLGQIGPGERTHHTVLPGCEALRGALKGALFLDISPRLMREYVPRQMGELGTHGQNVSAILWRECQDHERKRDLLDWLTELCAPEVTDIDFIETELGDVMFRLIEAGGARISARSASDGTLRFLGELLALQTAPERSLVVMEEIENGLHPARVHLLIELIESVTRHRGIQVIATTHSPRVLKALSEESLGEAVVFGRHPAGPGTIARSLSALQHFDEIVKRRGIEELFTTQWLERAL